MPKKELVDLETGEMLYAVIPIRQKHLGGGFFMALQEGFMYLAQLDLPGRTRRVLDYLFAKLDFENWIRITQSQIAKDLGLDRADVSKAIKQLVDHQIILKGPKVGNSWTYRLDPAFGWKGKAKNKKAAERAIQKAREKGWDVIEGSDT
jgi:hypothetical protein